MINFARENKMTFNTSCCLMPFFHHILTSQMITRHREHGYAKTVDKRDEALWVQERFRNLSRWATVMQWLTALTAIVMAVFEKLL